MSPCSPLLVPGGCVRPAAVGMALHVTDTTPLIQLLGMCSPVAISQSWLHHTSTKSLNFRHIPNACLPTWCLSPTLSLVCWFCVSTSGTRRLLLQVLGRKKRKWAVTRLPFHPKGKSFPKWPVPTKQISMHLSLAQSMSCDLLASKKTGYRCFRISSSVRERPARRRVGKGDNKPASCLPCNFSSVSALHFLL